MLAIGIQQIGRKLVSVSDSVQTLLLEVSNTQSPPTLAWPHPLQLA